MNLYSRYLKIKLNEKIEYIIAKEKLQPGTDVSVEWLNAPFYYAGDAIVRGTVVSIDRVDGEDGSFRLSVKFSDKDSELVQSLLLSNYYCLP